MTQTDNSTALTRASNTPNTLSSKVTDEGKLSPESWVGIRKNFLVFAAVADYMSEMMQALAQRAKELAGEADTNAIQSEVTDSEKVN